MTDQNPNAPFDPTAPLADPTVPSQPAYPAAESYPATQPYPAAPAYPATPGYPAAPGYAAPGQPVPPGYPAAPGYAATPGYPPAPGYPTGYPGGEYAAPVSAYPGYGYPVAQKTNGLAIAALVCALAGLATCISAPVGAILGHVARKQIRERGESGDGMALAGIIVGWILTALILGYLVFVVVMLIIGANEGMFDDPYALMGALFSPPAA
ncbi:hypothetical protein Ais01nite_29260 [Asanoa ishikariensis]|uniref:DUF4190 domain-containing protein n=1 Tax=Asanoa ishikariensis TaxID=137265 RepID=A0A1H3QMP5_9ACTN|nr:DUF4190 domain-containing protein [Asanoa ishikariensis]GIF64891.1 hypothetical protein Ais01nite_29260 [Asanoa ishikariensis]SDZ14371.1 protein of unknown function [Asanoa ishikariensis]